VDGSEQFNTVLYTGDGTTGGRDITGVGFQPDFTWIKDRTGANYHSLHDAVRGSGQALQTNTTSSEYSFSDYFGPFISDGFTIASVLSGSNYNASGNAYASWNWKANGSGVSNTVGSIPSTVSANTTSGFSIVTGTIGAAGVQGTVGHGLGVAPEMILFKSTGATFNWAVFHASVSTDTTKFLRFNTSDALQTYSTVWGSALPTSTVFGATGDGAGSPSNSFVAYCFAAVEGFSAFGSYTGNGNATDGPFIYTGFRPAWIMVKRTNSADNWWMQDNARDPYNVAKHYLSANTNNAEFSNLDVYDYTANGFKIRTNTTAVNASGSTYIYMAFAENPFKNSLAR
jgi:hypothetical protein